ncbi:MAG: cyclic pyranopterin monophosphate synthase MoaC [Gammaproteobacteria bacterium]|nr:MAG: cyclic pyranopterin monophosphate synthase MoaC [Gammaproteobacteria bacterium]
MGTLTHFNEKGEAYMVDVGAKDITTRVAVAEGRISMEPETLKKIIEGSHKKGDVLGVARVAGIMGCKKTPDLIPMCHPISITNVDLQWTIEEETNSVHCKLTAKCNGQTGIEMEALTGVQIALLTIYDMCKAVDRWMEMKDVRLVAKSGGKSGDWLREEALKERNA